MDRVETNIRADDVDAVGIRATKLAAFPALIDIYEKNLKYMYVWPSDPVH